MFLNSRHLAMEAREKPISCNSMHFAMANNVHLAFILVIVSSKIITYYLLSILHTLYLVLVVQVYSESIFPSENIQYQSKVYTPTHSRVFLYFYYFLHCRIIVKTSKLWNNTLCSNQKVLNNSKHTLYLRFFKVATLCHDDSFAHTWHSLNQFHLECFSNRLERVPTYAEHMLAAFPSLCGLTPKPSQLGWGQIKSMLLVTYTWLPDVNASVAKCLCF